MAAPAAASLSSPEYSLRRPPGAAGGPPAGGLQVECQLVEPPTPPAAAAGRPGASASVTERQPERPTAAASRHYMARAVKPAAALYLWWTVLGVHAGALFQPACG